MAIDRIPRVDGHLFRKSHDDPDRYTYVGLIITAGSARVRIKYLTPEGEVMRCSHDQVRAVCDTIAEVDKFDLAERAAASLREKLLRTQRDERKRRFGL